MTTPSTTTRRDFLTRTAAVTAGAVIGSAPLGAELAVRRKQAPIRVAGIGLGPRGRLVLRSFLSQPDVRFVATADPQRSRREIIRRLVNRHYGDEECAVYPDMARVFEREDIDAVIIAAGDRWHGTAAIRAVRAGKDVYCEKPCTMSVEEALQLDAEVQARGRIYQGGMQRRHVENFERAVGLARRGRLGTLRELHAGIWLPLPVKPDLAGQPEPEMAELDWDAWVGPAAERPYHPDYVRGQWRGYRGFSAGWGLHDWASHTVNLCQWALDADATVPVEYWFEDRQLKARYASGELLVMRVAGFKKEGDWLGLGSCPIRLIGDRGWVEAGDFGKMALSDDGLDDGPEIVERAGTDPDRHVREFLDSVQSRMPSACHSGVVRTTETACHAAAISWKLGRRLQFDPATSRFVGDEEANAPLRYERRPPHTL